MSFQFRSLSSRNLELWFNDGRDGIQQGHLHMGQETTTCSYPGHRFFVTEAGHKETHVVDFLITSDRVCVFYFVNLGTKRISEYILIENYFTLYILT